MMINKLAKSAFLLQALSLANPTSRFLRATTANYSWSKEIKSKEFLESSAKSRISLTSDQNNSLWSILKSRTKIKKSSPIEQTIHLCKKITGYYNRANKNEFLKAQDEINKIVEELRSMQLGDQPYQTYCNILDFLDVVVQVFGKNANSTNLKDIVFMNLAQSIKLQKMTFSQQSRIYASLAKNKYPKLQQITEIILKSLKNTDTKIYSHIIEKIIQGISSRTFLNKQERQIFKILLQHINQQIKQITPKCIGATVHLIESLELRAVFKEKQITIIMDRLETHLALFIQNVKLGDPTLTYMLSLDLKMKKKSIIYESIWKKVLKEIERNSQNEITINTLAIISQKLHSHEHTQQEKLLIANYLKNSYENKQTKAKLFSNMSIEKIIVHLFQGKLIDSSCINAYNSIISAPTFTVHWNHLQHYTRNQFVFPQAKLEDFLISNKKSFFKQNVLTKAAVIIPIQAKHYPLNEVIQECSKNIVRVVAEYNWNAQSLDWMLQEVFYDSFIMESFHSRYHHHFLDKIKKTLTESNEAALINYYSYIFEMESKHNVKRQMIQAMPEKILLTIMSKEHSKQKKRINKLLLSTIVYKINSKTIYLKSQIGKEVLKIAFLYSNILWRENQAAVNEYFSFLQALIMHYSILAPGVSQFNLALKRILREDYLESQKIHHSLYYFQFLETLKKQLPVIKQKSKDQSLVETIEQSLRITSPHKPSKQTQINTKIGQSSAFEVISLQLHSNKATPQELKPIIQSVRNLSLFEIEQLIITKFKNAPHSKLCIEILSQYLKKFQPEISNSQWKIILFSKSISSKLYHTQLNRIINKILDKLAIQDIYYKDHLFLLNYITLNGMNMYKYKLALYNHLSTRFHHQKHNGAYLALMTKLSLYVEFSDEIVQLLLNQMDTNPNNQLKLIAFFHDKISQRNAWKNHNEIFSIINSIVNNSLAPIKSSLFLSYIQSISSQQYKKIISKHINNKYVDDSLKITKYLTDNDRKILEVLEKKDKITKQTYFREDLYLFNKFIIIFSSSESAEIGRIFKGALKARYSTHHIFIFTKSNKKEIKDFVNRANLANSTLALSLSDFIKEESETNTN